MPRKIYRHAEGAPQGIEIPPGSGKARLAETKKNLAAGRAEAAALKALSPKEREAMRLRMESDSITEANAHELEPLFEKATEEFDLAEQRFQIHPSDENEAAMEAAREKANKLHVQINEMLPEGRSRKKSSETLAHEAHEAFVAKHEDRGVLLAEQASLKDRMQEMGGVWGGESYFILNDRLEEIERAVRKMDTGSEKRPMESLPAIGESFIAGEPTANERVVDARKTLKQMKNYERDIAIRQKKLQTELAHYGIRSPAQIDAELSELSPELREASAGAKPGLWFKLRKMARGLAGMERPPEVKELLKKYVDLETEMNGEIHNRREAELALETAEAAAGKTRVRLAAPLTSVAEQPALNIQQEMAAVRALKMLEEEMQDDMMNFAGKKDEFTTEDMELYTEKLDSLKQRLNALDESAGDSEAAKNASHAAREMYVQYRRQLSQGASAIVGQAQTAGPGEARPLSVISRRTRGGDRFTPSHTVDNAVQLSKMETADKKEQREQEKAAAKERVNKDVQVYRSIKWRKALIDTINSEEAVRSAMHSIYEAYKKRVQDMMAKGELNLITGSPDPALDYTLDLYRLYARKANGKHLYDERICQTALEEINRVDELLGAQWDTDRTTDRLVSALLTEKPNVVVDKAYLAETAAANDNAEVAPVAEPTPLIHEKRSRSAKELKVVEEEEAVTEVPPVLVEPAIEQKAEVLPERNERLHDASEALDDEFRKTFGLNRYVAPEAFARTIESKHLQPKNDGKKVRDRISELEALAKVLPEGDVRERSLAEASRFRALMDKYAAGPVIEQKVEAPREPGSWVGPSTSKPIVERRTIRHQASWSPETKTEIKKKPYGSLTELEYADLEDSLNRRVLALGNKWLKIGPKVKSILANSELGWIEQYAELYKEGRVGETPQKERMRDRELLDRVNKLLGIDKPSELIIPPSQELNEALSKEAQLAEKQRMTEQKKIKPVVKEPVKPMGFGDDVIKGHRARNAMKANKRDKKGV